MVIKTEKVTPDQWKFTFNNIEYKKIKFILYKNIHFTLKAVQI